MKKKGIILMAVLLVVFVGLAIAVKSADSSTKMDKKNLTVVTAPDQRRKHRKMNSSQFLNINQQK